jgi:hypothetical protein
VAKAPAAAWQQWRISPTRSRYSAGLAWACYSTRFGRTGCIGDPSGTESLKRVTSTAQLRADRHDSDRRVHAYETAERLFVPRQRGLLIGFREDDIYLGRWELLRELVADLAPGVASIRRAESIL